MMNGYPLLPQQYPMAPSFAQQNPMMTAGILGLGGGLSILDILEQRKLRRQLMEQAERIGGAQRTEIQKSARQTLEQLMQRIPSQNISMQRGAIRATESDRLRNLQRLRESLATQRMGVLQQTAPDYANLAMLGLQTVPALFRQYPQFPMMGPTPFTPSATTPLSISLGTPGPMPW